MQGGFGAAVLELLNDNGLAVPVVRVGIPDQFVEQGTQAELRSQLGLDADGIVATIKKSLQEKQIRLSAS